MIPVILHIPHASKVIPSELREQFFINTGDLEEEIRLITDHYTDELFAGGKDSAVIFPVRWGRWVFSGLNELWGKRDNTTRSVLGAISVRLL